MNVNDEWSTAWWLSGDSNRNCRRCYDRAITSVMTTTIDIYSLWGECSDRLIADTWPLRDSNHIHRIPMTVTWLAELLER